MSESKVNKLTLREFINENYRLFTTMGVVGGLTTLFVRLEEGEYLVAIGFAMFFLLVLELWRAFPKYNESSRMLNAFKILVNSFMVFVGMYVFMFFIEQLYVILITIFIVLYSGVVLRFLQRSEKTRWIILVISAFFTGIIGVILIQYLLG